jgi:F0F1-type ATP synthase membrane subunit a
LLKVYADILHSSVKENFANLILCISSWIVSMNLPILDKKKKKGGGAN